jgi:hypothetical protein
MSNRGHDRLTVVVDAALRRLYPRGVEFRTAAGEFAGDLGAIIIRS